ncbi:MAG: hypothetical protein GY800_04775 [Planctomycetes bacterium]|nr:hypothetical protein [Planctomycetota bacterium]
MKRAVAKNLKKEVSTTTLEEIIMRHNKVIISLLAKRVMGEAELIKIVTKNKRDPKAYLKGYNACDGVKGVNDLAKAVGVTAATLSPILQDWEQKGIVYDVGNSNKPLYVKLMNLDK